MHTRLSIFIDYATKGNKAEFARAIGVRPQLLTKLLQGTAFGVTAINAILRAYPELNARWLLLGEGGMLRGQMVNAMMVRIFTYVSKDDLYENQEERFAEMMRERAEWKAQGMLLI